MTASDQPDDGQPVSSEDAEQPVSSDQPVSAEQPDQAVPEEGDQSPATDQPESAAGSDQSVSPDQPVPVESVTCPACAEPVGVGANWCEACGHDLVENPSLPTVSDTAATDSASTVACQACGETDVDAEGYCLSCGYRQPSERNHVGDVVGPIAAATDRGSIRHRNEDAFAVAMADHGRAVMVVCDGVSSTPGSEEASTSAAQAACTAVVEGLNNAGIGPVSDEDIEKLLTSAVAEAQKAATAAADVVSGEGGAAALTDPPSTTLVCAVATPVAASDAGGDAHLDLHVAWVGDSRCYWVTAAADQLLTTDHEEMGALSRWLGADAIQPEPDIVHHKLPLGSPATDGWVLVCSDGLWRYLTPTTGMTAHELIAAVSHNLSRSATDGEDEPRLPPEPGSTSDDVGLADQPTTVDSSGDLARRIVDGLVEFANNRGGHDNITAAITFPSTFPTVSLERVQESP